MDHDLQSTANNLRRSLEAYRTRCREFGADHTELAYTLGAHAKGMEGPDGWVGRVGEAFRRADRAPGPVLPGVVLPTEEGLKAKIGREAEDAVDDVSVYAGRTMTAEAGVAGDLHPRGPRHLRRGGRMIANGASVEDPARWAHAARNELKVQIRAKGSPITKGLAEARNINKYGDKVGPTYDDLIRQGKTPEDIIGSSGRANVKATQAATRMRVGGGFLIAVDLAIVTWEVTHAEPSDRLRTLVEGAGGVGGALAGGWAGAKGGAAVGSLFGPWGTAIGGVIGAIGGSIVGGTAGRAAAGAAYDIVEDLVTPGLDAAMGEIDAREDAYIRQPR
ncbi:MAG: hypothetical protein ACRDYX_05530 [Egibacteraceae bacterium]